MKSGGSNLTQQHAEDLSLCALFLIYTSKRVAHEFGARRSQSHSTRDANKDITNVVNYFLEKKVAHEIPERTSIGFKDPTDDGLDKMCNTRIPYPEQGVTTTWKKTQYMSLQNVIKIMNYLMSLSLLC